MLFLSPGKVYWLQTLLHWCHNNTVFIVDVSRVYASGVGRKFSWGFSFNGRWWSFVFGVRSLWRHIHLSKPMFWRSLFT